MGIFNVTSATIRMLWALYGQLRNSHSALLQTRAREILDTSTVGKRVTRYFADS